jgi:hypothetical protein
MTMAVRLNHTLVAARDNDSAAKFLTAILGLPAPSRLGPFAVVHGSEDTSLDDHDADGAITSQHDAFLVDERVFDVIFARIRDRRLAYWAAPSRHQRDEMNRWDGGRGLYVDDPNGHLLERLTRLDGSGGTTTSRPHPLVAPTLEPAEDEGGHSGQQGQTGGGRLAPAERPDRRDE